MVDLVMSRDEATAGKEGAGLYFPITAPHSNGPGRYKQTKQHDTTRMINKGSTTFDSNSGDLAISTIPISAAPSSPPSTLASTSASACRVDERGRTICSDQTRIPHPIRQRSSELGEATWEFGAFLIHSLTTLVDIMLSVRLYSPTISPFILVVIIFHGLLLIQLTACVIEDGVIKEKLSTKGPCKFSTTRGLGWGKRFARMRYRMNYLVQRFGRHLCGLLILGGIACIAARECIGESNSSGVPFGRLFILEETVELSRTWIRFNGFAPEKTLIALEVSTYVTHVC